MNPIEKFIISPEKELTELMAQLNAECSDIADKVAHKMTILEISFVLVKITKSFSLAIHNIDGRICFSSGRNMHDNKAVWEQIDKTHGVTLTDYGYFIPADRRTKMQFASYQYDILSYLDAMQIKAIEELKDFFDY